MKNQSADYRRKQGWLKRNVLLVALLWTGVIAGLLAWNLREQRDHLLESVTGYARYTYNKDVVYRRWVASHGGVYVPATAATPPNPYLARIPHRDVVTAEGMKLTLINPAYMTRQVYALGREQYGFRGHITSLKPLRSENYPDPWEKKALLSFENGVQEVVEVSRLNGDRYLRLMRPLMAEKGCLKCHVDQGYKLGDIRGGVSVSINLEPILAVAVGHWWDVAYAYGAIWLLGLVGIYFSFLRFNRHFSQLEKQKNLLQQTRDHFKNFYQLAPVPFQSLYEDGMILEVNNRWLDILGYQVDEVIGKPFVDFLASESVDEFLRQYARLKKDVGHLDGVILDIKHRDGRIIKGRYYGQAELDDQGGFRRSLCVFYDVTERVKQRETIAKLQQRNEAILMAAGEGIIGLDKERKPMFVNLAAAEMFGCSPEELLGRDSHETWHQHGQEADSHGPNSCQICMAMEMTKGKSRIIDTLCRRDGSSFPAELTISPITWEGENMGAVVVFTDISERLENQKQLTVLAALVEQSFSSVVLTDLDFRLSYVNPACEQSTGYQAAEVIGRKITDCFSPAEVKDDVREEMMDNLLRGEIWRGRLKTRTKNGTILEEEGVAFPIRNKQGKVIAYAGIRHDISAQRQLELQLNQVRKMESIGQLAGGVAHDFNNILTVINGYAQILLMKLDKDSQLWHDAREIEKAGERAAALTRQLLAFSRKQVIMPKAIRVNDELAEMEKMLRRLIGEDIDMDIIQTEGLPLIYADPGQLQQILLNLVVNARDALCEKVGGEKKITISTAQKYLDDAYVALHTGSRPGWHVQIVVEDTGTGMSKEVMGHIFEPFYTTKAVGQGTGMGLATVYGIVKQNNADIFVYSEPGQGTAFKIYWPVMVENSMVEKRVEDSLPAGGNEVVLLVEDDEALRKITGRQLRQVGYLVIEAANGKEALEKAADRQPGTIDLLFTDVVMPVMGGRELFASIQDIHPGIIALYASGYPDEHIRRDIIKLGEDRFIHKPYDIKNLLRRIRSLLDARQV